jgi:(p)ppGpp synthase/HD superfamily hydrolase
MPNYIDTARTIAKIAHASMVDKVGKPYFGHAHRVATNPRLTSGYETCAGYLHDVLEDTTVTAEDLRNLGVDSYAISLVETLTHLEDETYFDYIDRVSKSAAATRIKLADLEDNLDESRWPDMPDSMKARYLKAKSILETTEEL